MFPQIGRDALCSMRSLRDEFVNSRHSASSQVAMSFEGFSMDLEWLRRCCFKEVDLNISNIYRSRATFQSLDHDSRGTFLLQVCGSVYDGPEETFQFRVDGWPCCTTCYAKSLGCSKTTLYDKGLAGYQVRERRHMPSGHIRAVPLHAVC